MIKELSSEYCIDTSRKRINTELVHQFLSQESYWAKERSFEEVKKSIEHSLCFGLYKNEKMVGFARVVTDFSVFAYLADVFIVNEERSNGLGKTLIEYILDFPMVKDVNRWMLGTLDAHELYRPYGFTEVKNPNRWMERLIGSGF